MIDLGLTAAQNAHVLRLLKAPHSIRVAVQVQTLQEEYTMDLSPYLLGGQVNIDNTQQVTRSADLEIFDPLRRIQLDPDDPSKLAVGMADLLKIHYIIGDPVTKEYFNIPLFCGPIDDVSRDQTSLNITCVGKEALAVGNSYVGKIYKKGSKKTDVIKDILRNIMGETKYQVPDLASRLPSDWRLSQGDIPWDQAKKMAKSLGYQLFYDGRGVCRMRVPGGKALFTFDNTWVSSVPEIDWSTDSVVNTVIVKGAVPKKAKTNISYTAVAPSTHPLSPVRLGRAGVPRYLYTTVENDGLKSVAECKALAVQTLNRGLVLGFDAKWDGLPVPMLEEGDMVRVDAGLGSGALTTNVALDVFSIPLTVGTASYGYSRKVGQRGGHGGISGKSYRSYTKKAHTWAAQIRKADRLAAKRKKHREEKRKKKRSKK